MHFQFAARGKKATAIENGVGPLSVRDSGEFNFGQNQPGNASKKQPLNECSPADAAESVNVIVQLNCTRIMILI